MDQPTLEARREELREELQRVNRELRRVRHNTANAVNNDSIGLSALVLRCATEAFPRHITPKQVIAFCEAEALDTRINRINAQLSRLVKQEKLARIARGQYVLVP